MHEIIESSVLYQELAIQEISRGYKLTARLQTFLPKGEPQLELVGVLLEEVLQALSMALSMLKKSSNNTCTQTQASSEQVISETSSACFSNQGSTEAPEEVKIPATSTSIVCGKRGQRSKTSMDPWTKVTYAPHDDGYQWRKYGQKNLQKSKLARSYYRCTYKDEGCQATKHVQQKDNNDPPLFLVTFYKQHTCKTNNNPMIITPQITQDPILPVEPNLFSFESNSNMLFCNQERAMFQVSTTDQQDSDQEWVDLQNVIIDQTAMGSVLVNSEQCLEAIPSSSVEDLSLSACVSPPWEVMIMDYLKMDSFGSCDPLHEGFSSF